MIYFSRLVYQKELGFRTQSSKSCKKSCHDLYIYHVTTLYIYIYIYILHIHYIYIICYKYICKIIFSQLILKFSARLCHTVRRNNSGYDIKRPVKYLFSVKFIFGWKGLFEKDRC